MGGDDAVDESKLVLCCALCCVNLSTYPSADCLGCSGKSGICCLNCEFCCKVSLVEADGLMTQRSSFAAPITSSLNLSSKIYLSLELHAYPAGVVVPKSNVMAAAYVTLSPNVAVLSPPRRFPAMTKFHALWRLQGWPCSPSAVVWFPWKRLWIVRRGKMMGDLLFVWHSQGRGA